MMLPIRDKYFRLYSNCIPVKGYSRSIIYDLQLERWDFIPNALYDILVGCVGEKISEIYLSVDTEDHAILDEYFHFLIENEYLHVVEDKEEFDQFPVMDMIFDMPNIISNAILDFDKDTFEKNKYHDYLKVFFDLADLGCHLVQVRYFGKYEIDEALLELLSNVQELDFQVELLLPYLQNSDLSFYEQISLSVKNLNLMIVYSTPEEMVERYASTKYPIVFTHNIVETADCCGKIDPRYFTLNPLLFAESLTFNSCLNRKLGVDKDGFIKNCPSMERKFLRIGEGGISDLVLTDDFRSLWNVRKDDIDVCKICEFRYMCTDCRAFVSNNLDKPRKCRYNPLTGEWS